LSDQVITSGEYDVSPARISHLGQDLSHTDSDSGLTSSWGSCEAHVKRGHRGFESEFSAHLVKNQKRSNFFDTLLNRDETNELPVKLGKLVLDTFLEHKFID
jgi:hypothetical protein